MGGSAPVGKMLSGTGPLPGTERVTGNPVLRGLLEEVGVEGEGEGAVV